jgi:hypothetical protein
MFESNKFVVITIEQYNEIIQRIIDLEKVVENIINSK